MSLHVLIFIFYTVFQQELQLIKRSRGSRLPVEIRDELILLVAHARSEVRDADIGLFRPPEVGLRNQHVAHRQHSETSELLRRVEHDRWKSTRHFRVESDLDSCLDLVLALDEQVQQLLRVHHRLAEVRHQTDQSCIPLVHNLHIIVSH